MPRVTIKITEKDRGWLKLKKMVKELAENPPYAKVGVLEDGKQRRGSGPTNAEIAGWMEFGVPSKHIPERSFIRSTFDARQNYYVAKLRLLVVKGIYEGKMTPQKALNIVGAMAASDMKKRVTTGEGIPPPNAPKYKAWKERVKAKGSALGSRTLILTGQMVKAITWLVVGGSNGE